MVMLEYRPGNRTGDRQVIALRESPVATGRIYIDRQSGKDFDRPQYRRMLHRLRRGDLLYVVSIDRMGRNYEEIQRQWRLLTLEMGVNICVIDMPLLDTCVGKDLHDSIAHNTPST